MRDDPNGVALVFMLLLLLLLVVLLVGLGLMIWYHLLHRYYRWLRRLSCIDVARLPANAEACPCRGVLILPRPIRPEVLSIPDGLAYDPADFRKEILRGLQALDPAKSICFLAASFDSEGGIRSDTALPYPVYEIDLLLIAP